jgi:hypothetical protein
MATGPLKMNIFFGKGETKMSVIQNLECWLDTIVEDCFDFYVITQCDKNLEIIVFDDDDNDGVGEPSKFLFDKSEVPTLTAFLRSLSVLRVQSRFVKGLADAIEVYLKLPREENKAAAFFSKRMVPIPIQSRRLQKANLNRDPGALIRM